MVTNHQLTQKLMFRIRMTSFVELQWSAGPLQCIVCPELLSVFTNKLEIAEKVCFICEYFSGNVSFPPLKFQVYFYLYIFAVKKDSEETQTEDSIRCHGRQRSDERIQEGHEKGGELSRKEMLYYLSRWYGRAIQYGQVSLLLFFKKISQIWRKIYAFRTFCRIPLNV